MSADVLRRAAGLMRERAEAARAGAWYTDGTDILAAWSQPRPITTCNGSAVLEGNLANAQHIAGMHPTVALAVARWITHVLDRHEPITPPGDDPICGYCVHRAHVFAWPCVEVDEAIAVARAYLGEDPA